MESLTLILCPGLVFALATLWLLIALPLTKGRKRLWIAAMLVAVLALAALWFGVHVPNVDRQLVEETNRDSDRGSG